MVESNGRRGMKERKVGGDATTPAGRPERGSKATYNSAAVNHPFMLEDATEDKGDDPLDGSLLNEISPAKPSPVRGWCHAMQALLQLARISQSFHPRGELRVSDAPSRVQTCWTKLRSWGCCRPVLRWTRSSGGCQKKSWRVMHTSNCDLPKPKPMLTYFPNARVFSRRRGR